MKQNQIGATLIVVLIFLLAITVIGTIAIRQSMVGLNIATNSQVSQLVMQNSDAAFFNVEQADQLIQSLGADGMFGYISGPNDKDKELVFCFRGDQTSFFDLSKASLMQWEGGKTAPTNNVLGTDGYCDAADLSNNWFTSGRKAVMTQVAVKFSTTNQQDPFYDRQRGSDEKQGQIETAKRVKVFAVSLMPSLTNVDRADINKCLKEHMSELSIPDGTATPAPPAGKAGTKDDATATVTQCLTSLNVPFTTQVSEYTITQNFS
ncbi:pilus assembly PilX N-terminal domain-containing protein [Acinetobacter junii]|uniref:pilus assembly PilX family protein n=1 Tax=Acinetobacter TaxID=469 RepID=UPI001F2429B4|nr:MULTISPECIES: pilus assembly PilX N-terminal domain-containing protein [Acinetobacter]MCE6003291.1 pilus assembly PilX N-terminal domain-containing protein [Acinetobacter junii]MCU4394601.1 pilus assembly PilX N-terminal domain-containing protein [Acinetobacter parvus]MCU4611678.1 pilus assembly PilX N-terminal domain-containing protein [Acinetobacter parvus]